MRSYPNLKLRGHIWHYEFERRGERFRGSTNTHLVREAMVIVQDKIREAEAGGEPVTEQRRDGAVLSVAQLEAWDLNRAKLAASHRKADATIKDLWRRLSRFFDTVLDVNDDSIAAYAGRMKTEGYSSATIKRDLWAIRRAYAWAAPTLSLPALGKTPVLAVTPKGKTRGRVLEDRELVPWLEHLRGRALAHALIGLSTGIRREELERAQQSWLRRKDGLALVMPEECTKGRSERWAPLTPQVYAVCQDYLPLVQSPTAAWRTAARKAGIDTVAMRDLRHTFASRMSRYDSDAVRIISGWSTGDKNASMFYQHLTLDRAKRIREALDTEFSYLAGHALRSLVENPSLS